MEDGDSIIGALYRRKQEDFREKLRDMTDPYVVYVTDLVSCSHKRVMRQRFPLLSFRFEPALVLGDLVHAGLEVLLGESGGWKPEVELAKEYRVEGETYTVKGRADLVKYGEDGEPEIVAEIKTGRDLPGNQPHSHHVEQLRIYMELLGAEKGVLVYITPERLLEFHLGRGPGFDVEARLAETVRDAARPRFDWECRYCPFRRFCPFSGAATR